MIVEAELREEVCAAFSEVLDIAEPAVTADFFELGGTSFDAVKLLSSIRQRTGRRITIRNFLGNPTVLGVLSCLKTTDAPGDAERTEPPDRTAHDFHRGDRVERRQP